MVPKQTECNQGIKRKAWKVNSCFVQALSLSQTHTKRHTGEERDKFIFLCKGNNSKLKLF